METNPITIIYTASVYVDAGWRSVSIQAEAVPCGRGLVEVRKVIDVDGNDPTSQRASRTGAARQEYRPTAIAAREIGRRKRRSACEIVA